MSAPTEAAVVPKIDTLWVLHYKYCEGDVATIRAPYRGEHVALAKSAWEKGDFVMGGALADPIDSALIVFKSKEAAEDFAKRDPYVLNGVVVSHENRLNALALPRISRAVDEGDAFKLSIRVIAASIPGLEAPGLWTRERPRVEVILKDARKSTEFGDFHPNDLAVESDFQDGEHFPWRFDEILTFAATLADVAGASLQVWVRTESDLRVGPLQLNLTQPTDIGMSSVDLRQAVLPACDRSKPDESSLDLDLSNSNGWTSGVMLLPLTYVGTHRAGGAGNERGPALGEVAGHVAVSFSVNSSPSSLMQLVDDSTKPFVDRVTSPIKAWTARTAEAVIIPVRWMRAVMEAMEEKCNDASPRRQRCLGDCTEFERRWDDRFSCGSVFGSASKSRSYTMFGSNCGRCLPEMAEMDTSEMETATESTTTPRTPPPPTRMQPPISSPSDVAPSASSSSSSSPFDVVKQSPVLTRMHPAQPQSAEVRPRRWSAPDSLGDTQLVTNPRSRQALRSAVLPQRSHSPTRSALLAQQSPSPVRSALIPQHCANRQRSAVFPQRSCSPVRSALIPQRASSPVRSAVIRQQSQRAGRSAVISQSSAQLGGKALVQVRVPGIVAMQRQQPLTQSRRVPQLQPSTQPCLPQRSDHQGDAAASGLNQLHSKVHTVQAVQYPTRMVTGRCFQHAGPLPSKGSFQSVQLFPSRGSFDDAQLLPSQRSFQDNGQRLPARGSFQEASCTVRMLPSGQQARPSTPLAGPQLRSFLEM